MPLARGVGMASGPAMWRSGWITLKMGFNRDAGVGIIPSDNRPLMYWREWAKGGRGGVFDVARLLNAAEAN